MKEFINRGIKKLMSTGFFHIFGATVVNKILAFLSNFFIVRLISKSSFGIYTYANNILSFLLLLSGMGLVSGVFQLCSENAKNKKKAEEIYSYGTKIGIAFNILLTITILIISILCKLPFEGANKLLAMMSITPLINILFEFQQIYLRFNLKNKEYSYASTVNTVLILIFSVAGAGFFAAPGLIFGRYIAYIISEIINFKIFKAPIFLNQVEKITRSVKSVLYRISIISMLNNGLSQTLYLLDVFILGIVGISGSGIASYKVATIIPTALYFIPSAVCVYIYPYFAMNKDDTRWVIDNYKKTTLGMIAINGLITIILIAGAPLIINLCFGKQYANAVKCFRILMLGFFMNGSFRGIAGNLLVTQRRLKFNLFEGLVSGGVNIIGNLILIPRMGSIGAAIATLCVMNISAVLSSGYFIYVLKKKETMDNSLQP